MIFFNTLEKYSQNTALITESGVEVKYQSLIEDADKIAGIIGKRSLVFCVCGNNHESVAGYLGCLRARIVPILINPDIDKELYTKLEQTYKPSYVWAPREFVSGDIVYSFGNYNLTKTEYNTEHNLHPELALLLTTSGSTGSPKLVRQSYKNIESNTQSIIEYLRIADKDRAITTLPMSYTYGLSILHTHLASGATVILTGASLMSKSFWTLLKEQKATTFGGVPYTYEMLKKLRFSRMDLPSISYLTQAGGKLSKELSLEFATVCKDKGIKFIVMYGQSEATARMSYLPWEYAISKAGSMGIAIPHGKFKLIDVNGKEITSPHVMGELEYHGDNVTLGYAESIEDLSKGDERHGVLQTGDMAETDEDGFYYIVGRKKRFLKIYGNRVNLDEVEALLKTAGFECAVGGVDDCMKIFVTDRSKLDEVRHFVSEKTGLNMAAFDSVYISEIPRNESGKVQYANLENM